MSNIGNVWVFVEQEGGKIADVSLELVSKGAELAAKLNVKLEAILLGNKVEQCCPTLFSYGCHKVILAEDPRLEPFTVLPYAKVIMDLIRGRENTLPDQGVLTFLFQNPWSLIVLTVVLMFAKPLVSAILFTGAFLGYAMSKFLNLTGIAVIDPVNCIAVGMGGVLAGVMHAPLTGMFLIAELTGGYRLFVPLMIVVALSSFISKRLVKHNVYKSMIAMKGGTPEQRDDEVMLTSTHLRDLVETDYITVRENDTLRSLLRTVMQSSRNIFPVVNEDKQLVGVVRVDSIRKLLFNSELYDMILVYDVMSDTGPVLDSNDTLNDAVLLFDRLRLWNLPVTENGKYLGFVSKVGIYDNYRRMLQEKHDLF